MALKSPALNRVLILTASAGGGHLSIAKALEEIILNNHQSSQISVVNTTQKSGELFYRHIANQFSAPFSMIWDWSNTMERTNTLCQLNDFATRPRIQKHISKLKPTLVISTEPFSVYSTQKIINDYGLNIPHLVYVADPFNVHCLWGTLPHATRYLCQTEEAKQKLVEMGVSPEIITTVGFLVRSQYYQPIVKIPTKKVNIFVGGSGEGGGDILKIVKKIASDKTLCKKIRLTVLCGKNHFLKTQISLLPAMSNVSHKVVGYTPRLHQYLAQADFVVGKPGPNLLFESIMYLKPFIAIGEPLAQELGNYSYIDKERIGYSATNIRLAFDKVKLLVNDPKVITTLTAKIAQIRSQQIKSQQKAEDTLSPYL